MKGFVQGLYMLSEFSLYLVVLKIKFIKNIYDLEATVYEDEV
ncbi:hypothetical protein QFZ28_003896 [Neobacillus niacini]|nr:hypothetical protein [Neobacillus niacini]